MKSYLFLIQKINPTLIFQRNFVHFKTFFSFIYVIENTYSSRLIIVRVKCYKNSIVFHLHLVCMRLPEVLLGHCHTLAKTNFGQYGKACVKAAAIFNSIGTKSVTLLQNADCTWILFLSLEAKGENNIRDYSSEIIKGYA